MNKTALAELIEQLEGYSTNEAASIREVVFMNYMITIAEQYLHKEREQMEDMFTEGFNEGCKMMGNPIQLNNSKQTFDQNYTQE